MKRQPVNFITILGGFGPLTWSSDRLVAALTRLTRNTKRVRRLELFAFLDYKDRVETGLAHLAEMSKPSLRYSPKTSCGTFLSESGRILKFKFVFAPYPESKKERFEHACNLPIPQGLVQLSRQANLRLPDP